MAKTLKARASILVPTIEEVPRISDAERRALQTSLEQAHADIAAGNYDVVTSASLRREFDRTSGGSKNAKALEDVASRRPASKRKRP
jgi:hypothetical protein